MGREVRILDARSGVQQGDALPHGATVMGLEFSADARRLLVSTGEPDTGEGRILVWSVPEGRRLVDIRASERAIPAVAFTRHDREIVSASFDGSLRRHDAVQGLPTGDPWPLTELRLRRLSVGPSGQRMIVTGWSGKAWRLDVRLPATPMPDWVLELAECLAGERVLADGTVRRVGTAEFVDLRRRLGTLDPLDPWAAWASRFRLRDD
jgi:hypothetical protein